MTTTHDVSLICRVRGCLCALPLEHVVETMRPLPAEPFAGVPAFVRGIAIIRGAPVPVVDAGSIVGAGVTHPTRFVVLRTAGDRRVALAVDEVVGIRKIERGSLEELPPLVRDAGAEIISALGTLDEQLLIVLRCLRLVPESVWSSIDREGWTHDSGSR